MAEFFLLPVCVAFFGCCFPLLLLLLLLLETHSCEYTHTVSAGCSTKREESMESTRRTEGKLALIKISTEKTNEAVGKCLLLP